MALMRAAHAWVVLAIILATVLGIFMGNQRHVQAESLARQIVCKVFTQLNEVSQGLPVPFPPFRGGCNERGGIQIFKHVSGGTADAGDFLIHVKRDGTDIDFSPLPGVETGRGYGNVPPGTYTLSESGGPAGYTASFSGDCNSGGHVFVQAAVLSNCTITNTFTGGGAALCSDGIDNDSDTFTDTNDPNCHTDGDPTNASSFDANRSESGTLPACWNSLDDDGDGKVDMLDPGCSSPTDSDESDPTTPPLCSDGADNDGDGKIDLVDPGCSGASDDDETDTVPLALCADGIDNDGDTKVDLDDPGCSGPTDDDETDPSSPPQCADGIDNDGDSKIDIADPNCHTDGDASNTASYSPGRSETDALPACNDGLDNDGDGLTDTADPGCSNVSDTDETNPTNGGDSGGGTPSTPPSSGGGGNGPIVGSFGLVNGTVGGKVLGAATSTPMPPPTDACYQFLTAYIRVGVKNDQAQVRRLQMILRDFEGAKVTINGTYDGVTIAAVHAFQTKYASEVLRPWGIAHSTGYVYLTTRKKLNEVYCRGTVEFPLTEEQQRIIQETSVRAANVGAPSGRAPGAGTPAKPAQAASSASVTPPTSGNATTTPTSRTGSALWSLFKNIFLR